MHKREMWLCRASPSLAEAPVQPFLLCSSSYGALSSVHELQDDDRRSAKSNDEMCRVLRTQASAICSAACMPTVALLHAVNRC